MGIFTHNALFSLAPSHTLPCIANISYMLKNLKICMSLLVLLKFNNYLSIKVTTPTATV